MTTPQPGAVPGAPASGAAVPGQAPAGGQVEPPAGGPGAQAATDPPASKPAKTDLATLPDDIRDLIGSLRNENAEHRSGKATAVQAAAEAKAERDAILKAMGLAPDGKTEPLTADQIDAKIADAADDVWATKVENIVLRVPDVNVEALWDSRAFVDSLDPFADLDPKSDEFKAKVTEHVAKYVKNHPQFQAKPPGAARSGGDHPGGAGGVQTRPKSLGQAVSNHYRGRPGS